MNDESKKQLAEAGVKVGATLFGRLMDRIAAKRPRGLVAWWRKNIGRVTPEQISDEVTPMVNKALDRKRKK